MNDVKLLSECENYAVVQISGSAYPGIVFQDDSLRALIVDLRDTSENAADGKESSILASVIAELEKVQAHYESVLRREGLERPDSDRGAVKDRGSVRAFHLQRCPLVAVRLRRSNGARPQSLN